MEGKVPRQGYVLTQPGTPEEERLRLCWISPDRPERYFVPCTYVDACKIAGMLLKQIFVENGGPIKMHIHPSIANVNARAALSQRIMVSWVAIVQCFSGLIGDPSIPEETLLHPLSLLVSSLQTQTQKFSSISSSHIKASQTSILNLTCGSRNAWRKVHLFIRRLCIRTQVADVQEKSGFSLPPSVPSGTHSHSDELNLLKRTKNVYASGSLLKFLTKKLGGELVIVYTNNYVRW